VTVYVPQDGQMQQVLRSGRKWFFSATVPEGAVSWAPKTAALQRVAMPTVLQDLWPGRRPSHLTTQVNLAMNEIGLGAR